MHDHVNVHVDVHVSVDVVGLAKLASPDGLDSPSAHELAEFCNSPNHDLRASRVDPMVPLRMKVTAFWLALE